MNKVKFLSFLSIGLLLANLTLLGFMFFGKPPHPPHHHRGPKQAIVQTLSLDQAQVQAFDGLIAKHRSDIDQSEQEMLRLKNVLYSHLPQEIEPTTKDSLLQAIASIQFKIEDIHYKHFEEIKRLCKPEQLPAFQQLSKEIAALFDHKPPPMKK